MILVFIYLHKHQYYCFNITSYITINDSHLIFFFHLYFTDFYLNNDLNMYSCVSVSTSFLLLTKTFFICYLFSFF